MHKLGFARLPKTHHDLWVTGIPVFGEHPNRDASIEGTSDFKMIFFDFLGEKIA